jgi:hypothetical protein
MVRIPGSHNSKCVQRNELSQVKIIQKWDGVRPKIKTKMLSDFYICLADQKIKELTLYNNKLRNVTQTTLQTTLQTILVVISHYG